MKLKSVILYAEDDPDDRELLRDALGDRCPDHEILDVVNGREAILYLQSEKGKYNPPDLIVLDLNMPILSGRETLAIIKSESATEKIPVVILTTSGSPADKEFCNKFNVEMITKPASPQELREVADKLVKYCG